MKAEGHVVKLKQEVSLLQGPGQAEVEGRPGEPLLGSGPAAGAGPLLPRRRGSFRGCSPSAIDTLNGRLRTPPQAQVSNFQRENEALRSGQGASLAVVKQNTDVALQNLRVVMNSAHASIKQLVSGAETLNLVAEILKSIDRISEIEEEVES